MYTGTIKYMNEPTQFIHILEAIYILSFILI